MYALIPVLFRIPKHFWPLQVSADTTHFTGAFRGHKIWSFTGFASDIGKGSASYVSGSVDRISTEVVVSDQFMLTAPDGTIRSIQVNGFDTAIGVGHLVSVAWEIPRFRKTGPYFVVYNHTTRRAFFRDWTLRRMILPYNQYYMAGLFLLLLPIPLLLIIGITCEVQIRLFKRLGVKRLLAAFDRATSSYSQPREIKADDLGTLASLVREGLMTEDEWDRAKRLFLGKPADDRQSSLELLEQVYGLYRGGALSESEFNTKKWEILSRESRAKR